MAARMPAMPLPTTTKSTEPSFTFRMRKKFYSPPKQGATRRSFHAKTPRGKAAKRAGSTMNLRRYPSGLRALA